MDKQEYWNKLLERNPSMKNDIVKLKSSSLKAIVFQAFDKGVNSVKQNKQTQKPFKTGCKDLDNIFFGNNN